MYGPCCCCLLHTRLMTELKPISPPLTTLLDGAHKSCTTQTSSVGSQHTAPHLEQGRAYCLFAKSKNFIATLKSLSIIYQFQSRTKMLVCVVGSCPPSNNFLGVKLLHWAHSLLTKLFCPFLIYHITFFECALPRGQTHYVSKYTQSLKVGKRCQFSLYHHID